MRVRTHVNPLTYINRMEKINYSEFLPNFDTKPLDFEIGFGNGLFLKTYSQKHPERNLIGIEIRKPLALEVKSEFENEKIDNAYILHGKAEICFEDTIADNSLDKIFLFHPDPWVKRHHHKRRVIQPAFLNIIYSKLKIGGKFYVSTDVLDLWLYMEKIIKISGKFDTISGDDFWTEDYLTHWDTYSKKDNRTISYGTFLKK